MNIIAFLDGIPFNYIFVDPVAGDYSDPQQEKIATRFLQGLLAKNPNLVSNSERQDRVCFQLV
jgi:hypothetical protein